jgi:uncharacterized protein YkwD
LLQLVRRAATLIVLPVFAAGIALAAPASPSYADASSATTLARQVVTLTNKHRVNNGCARVRIDTKLTRAARAHSVDQARRRVMTHIGAGGTTFVTRTKRAGYHHPVGENVAYGYTTARAVERAWMKSRGHRANILNCKAKAVGVGMAYTTKRVPYWTQIFGRV